MLPSKPQSNQANNFIYLAIFFAAIGMAITYMLDLE